MWPCGDTALQDIEGVLVVLLGQCSDNSGGVILVPSLRKIFSGYPFPSRDYALTDFSVHLTHELKLEGGRSTLSAYNGDRLFPYAFDSRGNERESLGPFDDVDSEADGYDDLLIEDIEYFNAFYSLENYYDDYYYYDYY